VRGSSGRSILRGAAIIALASAGLLALDASALAAVDLGPGDAQPSIAYDATSGYTYVAWQSPSSDSVIDVCSVASAASPCNGGAGPDELTDPTAAEGGHTPTFFGSKVLVEPDGTVVVVADMVGGDSAVLPSGYSNEAGLVAWSSAAGGAAFGGAGHGLANGGQLVAESQGEMPNQGALALNDENILTYGNQYPFGSGATDFTLTAPAFKTTPLVDQSGEKHEGEFTDNGDANHLAAVEYPAKSGEYLVVTAGFDAGQPKECAAGAEEGTGYGVADATPANLQKQAAWSAGYLKVMACTAEEVVLVGGEPYGGAIGAVDSEGPGLNGGGEDGLYYRAFNTSSDTFGGPVLISQEGPFTLDGADIVTASDDSAGGVYAMWLDGRGWELSYSDTGGSSWLAPVTALPDLASDPVVAGVGGGNAEAAYDASVEGSTDEYLQPFNYYDLIPPIVAPISPPAPLPPALASAVATSQSGGGISGASLTEPQGTAVTDRAYLSGANAKSATGTVTYNVYKDSKCTVAAAAGSVADVVNGAPGPSNSVKLKPGTYYWRAVYSGDSLNLGSTSACGSEVLVVAANATTLGLPSSKMCLSKRAFVVHPRSPRGVKLVSVEVQINGKFIKRVKLSSHGGTPVSLVGLPKGTFKVALITKSSKGKTYEEVRSFHTCVPKKRKRHH